MKVGCVQRRITREEKGGSIVFEENCQFIRELRQFEKSGQFPNLTLICLPNDHTSGTKAGCPTPAASVADNDLALGRISTLADLPPTIVVPPAPPRLSMMICWPSARPSR